MSARRIDCAQVRTGGHTGPPLRWELPPRRAVHPKRSRPSFRNEKKLRFLLAYELRKQRVTRIVLTQRTLRPRVTLCRDARSERPLSNQLDALTFNGDGRSDRASLQRVTRIAGLRTEAIRLDASRASL